MKIEVFIYVIKSVIINIIIASIVCMINIFISTFIALWANNNRGTYLSNLIIYASIYYESIISLTIISSVKFILVTTGYRLNYLLYMLMLVNIYSMVDTILILRLIHNNRQYYNIIKSFRNGIYYEYMFTLHLYYKHLKYRPIINIANITTDDAIYFFSSRQTDIVKFIHNNNVDYIGLLINTIIFLYIFNRMKIL